VTIIAKQDGARSATCATCDKPFDFMFALPMRAHVGKPPVLGDFYQCWECKLLRLDEQQCLPDEAYETEEYHESVARDDDYAKYVKVQSAYAQMMAEGLRVPRGSNVADIGAGGGLVLDHLLQMDGSLGTIAVEPNEKFRGFITEQRRHHAFATVQDAYERFGATANEVLLLLVLEHVSDPWAVLRDVATLMAPGATLKIVVPCLDLDRAWSEAAYRNMWFCAQHRWYFTFESLGRMLNKCGYAVHGDPEYWTRPDGWMYQYLAAQKL